LQLSKRVAGGFKELNELSCIYSLRLTVTVSTGPTGTACISQLALSANGWKTVCKLSLESDMVSAIAGT